jgi:hypothetical protein
VTSSIAGGARHLGQHVVRIGPHDAAHLDLAEVDALDLAAVQRLDDHPAGPAVMGDIGQIGAVARDLDVRDRRQAAIGFERASQGGARRDQRVNGDAGEQLQHVTPNSM